MAESVSDAVYKQITFRDTTPVFAKSVKQKYGNVLEAAYIATRRLGGREGGLNMTREELEILDDAEVEGGECPYCGEPARLRTCAECGESAWIIDCGHYDQPRPIAAGRSDGSDGHHDYCEDCADR